MLQPVKAAKPPSAPAPCRSGSRGEAPWLPEATGRETIQRKCKIVILPFRGRSGVERSAQLTVPLPGTPAL